MRSTNTKRKLRLKRNVKLILIGILVLCILGLIMMMTSLNNESNQNDDLSNDVQQEINSEQNTEQWIEFPYLVDDGKLEIVSLFQFTGFNPDCSNEEGTDIAGIQLKNISDQHLKKLELTVILEDETELDFMAYEIPAGKTAMIFSIDNTSIKQDVKVKEMKAEAVFIESNQTEMIRVSTESVQIILTNTTDEEITNVTVYCHNILEEDVFGGIAYQYAVESIPAKDSAMIDAWDCFLGVAEVARIEINKGEQ